LEMIVTTARDLTGAEHGRIYVLDSTKRLLCLEVIQHQGCVSAEAALGDVPLRIDGAPNTRHVCAYSAFSGRLINIANVYGYAGFDFSDVYRCDQMHRGRTRSLITVPLRSCEETTNGVLQLANRRDPETGKVTGFDSAMEGIIRAFASQAAVAIDNVTLLEQKRRLIEVLDNANRDLRKENEALRKRVTAGLEHPSIIGESPAMRRLFDLISKIAGSDVTVLIRGETGTGKELIARTIHQNSRRRGREMVAQNCAAVPEGLLESELFGYRKGAFTGAAVDKKGLFEQADGGTLFLDEIGDLSIELQAKLLRVLQEGEIRPLGAVETRRVNVRVLAATHQDLEALVADGGFREDLYYRLMVFPIEVPPLRERAEDIPALIDAFLRRYSKRYERRISGVSPEALRLLLEHGYPGNVRELQNQVERAVLLAEPHGPLLPEHFPLLAKMPGGGASPALAVEDQLAPLGGGLKEMVRRFEAHLIEEHLRANNWNQTRTAELLGVPRRTLVEKIGRYHIERPVGH
jgi:transcriptional regulator with GAF, ATPase, and Fis domain